MEVRIGPCLCGEPEKVIKENGKQVLVRCPLYIKLKGQDPQSGDGIDHWGCSISWLPILLIENADKMRYIEGEIQELRKESIKGVGEQTLALVAIAQNLKEFRDEMVRQGQHVLHLDPMASTPLPPRGEDRA